MDFPGEKNDVSHSFSRDVQLSFVFLSFSWNFVTGPGATETRAILGEYKYFELYDHIPVVLLSRHNISICIYA